MHVSTDLPGRPAPAAGGRTHVISTPTSIPLLAQIRMLAWRALRVNLRAPAAIAPPFVLSLFTLFIYQAQFADVARSFLHGQGYLSFILPLSLVSAALSGASVAGSTLARDIERGYFDKLALAPASRWALLLGPTVAGAIVLAVQSSVLVLVGLALGLRPETGAGGLLVTVGLAVLVGVGFSGLSIGVALLTGNATATAGSSFLFFPLTFLTATFVPLDRLHGWIHDAAELNPITYILEPMRAILGTGWDPALIVRGLAAGALLFVALFTFALYGLRTRTRRR